MIKNNNNIPKLVQTIIKLDTFVYFVYNEKL